MRHSLKIKVFPKKLSYHFHDNISPLVLSLCMCLLSIFRELIIPSIIETFYHYFEPTSLTIEMIMNRSMLIKGLLNKDELVVENFYKGLFLWTLW